MHTLSLSALVIRNTLHDTLHDSLRGLLQKNVKYKTDPAWVSWLALVDWLTLAHNDAFTPETIIQLDKKIMLHHEKFMEVTPEYAVPTSAPPPT